MKLLEELLDTIPQCGSVEWIGVRPGRREPMQSVDEVWVSPDSGLSGDRYKGRSGNRQVTLIQFEHLQVIASCVGLSSIAPDMLRRNIVVRGINLLALKDKVVRVGEANIEVTGLCHPCSLMEDILGPGGYNAVRGHGGITARVLTEGSISIGDDVRYAPENTSSA